MRKLIAAIAALINSAIGAPATVNKKRSGRKKRDFINTKITLVQFNAVVHLRSEGFTYPEISSHTGLSKRTCYDIIANQELYFKSIRRIEKRKEWEAYKRQA